MYTKSIIQQTVEMFEAKNSFKTAIESLMEKYNIEDSVFIFNKGMMHEVVNGYFVVENEYNNISEAISNCNISTMGVRIMGNKFQIGTIHNKIAECESNKPIFDLTRLEEI